MTTRAMSALLRRAEAAHLSGQPWQFPNERRKSAVVRMVPWSNSPQPSTAPLASASVRPRPEGAFFDQGAGLRVADDDDPPGQVGRQRAGDGRARARSPPRPSTAPRPRRRPAPAGESAAVAGWKTSSEPPVVTSTGSAVATRAPTNATDSTAAVAPTAAHPRARARRARSARQSVIHCIADPSRTGRSTSRKLSSVERERAAPAAARSGPCRPCPGSPAGGSP